MLGVLETQYLGNSELNGRRCHSRGIGCCRVVVVSLQQTKVLPLRRIRINASIIDKLMRGLGFGSGYIAQGGDVRSIVSRLLGERFEACKVGSLHSLSPHSSITLIESRSGSCQFLPDG